MNSTLTRAISGAVYIVLLISATFYSSNNSVQDAGASAREFW